MKVISLGWGVQSFTIAAMSALGEIEPVDVALHADTRHESTRTYEFAKRWTPWLEHHGVRVVTVVNPFGDAAGDKYGGGFIPAFTYGKHGNGQLRRQCTHSWKIDPMRRWLQANRDKRSVEQWIGISLDEAHRAKPPDVKYITNRWPLLEKKMTRKDCKSWLLAQGLEVPPKSSCVFCPYHNAAGWRAVRNQPEDWAAAVEFDELIRDKAPPHPLFVHPGRIPLAEVDLRTPQERGQMELDWEWETEDNCPMGVCGV